MAEEFYPCYIVHEHKIPCYMFHKLEDSSIMEV